MSSATAAVLEGLLRIRNAEEAAGQLDRAGLSAEKLAGNLTKVGAVWTAATAAGIGFAVKAAAETEQMALSYEVLLKSADKAKGAIKDLYKFGAETPFEFPEVANAGKMLLSFGYDLKEIMPVLKDAGDAASGMGVSLEQVTDAFGRLKAGQFGEAFEAFRRLGIGVKDLQKVGLEFNKGNQFVGSIEQAIEGVRVVIQDRFGGMMERQSKTINGLLSTMKDNFRALVTDPDGKGLGDRIAAELHEPIQEVIALFEQWKRDGTLEDVADGIVGVTKAGIELGEKGIKMLADFSEKWKELPDPIKNVGEHIGAMAILGGPVMLALGLLTTSTLRIRDAWIAVTGAARTAEGAQIAAGVAGKSAAVGVSALGAAIAPIAGVLSQLYMLASANKDWQQQLSSGNPIDNAKALLEMGAILSMPTTGLAMMRMRDAGQDAYAGARDRTQQAMMTISPSGDIHAFDSAGEPRSLIDQMRAAVGSVRAVEDQCQANIGNFLETATGNRPTQGDSANDARSNALASGAARLYKQGQALNVGDKLYLSGGKYGHTVLYVGNGQVLDSSPGGTPIGNGWYLRPVSAYKGRIAAVEATSFRLGASGGGGQAAGGVTDWTRAGYTSKMMAEAGLSEMGGNLDAQQYYLKRALAGVQGDLGDLRKLGVSDQSEASLALRRQELELQKQIRDIETERLALLAGGTKGSLRDIAGYGATIGLMNEAALTGGAGRLAALAAVGSGFAPTMDTWSGRGLPATWMSGAARMPEAPWRLPAWVMAQAPEDPFAFYAGGEPVSWAHKAGSIASANKLIGGVKLPAGGGQPPWLALAGALASVTGGGGGSGLGGMLSGALSGYSQFSQLGSALGGIGAFGSLGGIGPDFGLIGLGFGLLGSIFKKQTDVSNKLLRENNKQLSLIRSKIDFVAAPGYAPVSAYASGRVRSL